jgi:ATP-dependent RNA helicase DDX46/PRP5
MAPHRTDHSRPNRDREGDRGGNRNSAAPRPDDRRDRDVYRDERDRQQDRRRHDENTTRDWDRGFDDRLRADDRRDNRRDDRRARDPYPPRRPRSRSPDRRNRHRTNSRDARDRRLARNDFRDRGDRYDPTRDRRRSDARLGSSRSATPSADLRPSSRQSNNRPSSRQSNHRPSSRQSNMSREERQRREEEFKKQEEEAKKLDEEMKKAARQARTEEWKKQQLARAQADSPAAASSPAPQSDEAVQEKSVSKAPAKTAAVKKPGFQLDPSAAARPAPFKSATKPNGTTVASTPSPPQKSKSMLIRTDHAAAPSSKAIGAFGLKTKAVQDDDQPAKKTLLDDGGHTGKRSLQALPTFTPFEGQEPDAVDANEAEDAMSDIGSPDAAVNAEEIAQLEKRRDEVAKVDIEMEEAPVVADEPGETMDVDDAAGAEDDVDPLDAFMMDLDDNRNATWVPSGQTMFNEEGPGLTAVEDEDLLAMAAASKKKKKVIPVIDHSKVEYEPFRKDFYTVPKEVRQMTRERLADLRLELDGIAVKPADVPRPVLKWAQMGLLQATLDVFIRLGYEKPTPIQAQAIPIAESGLDLIGVAKTGSGKTLAFGIPMIRHVLDQRALKSSDGPIGLILAPTRELANQIVNELKPFLKASNLHIACAYGGSPISEQISMIKRGGIHVLCATPGRLIDLLQSNSGRVLNLKRVTYVVLDEADRMFDMGFEPQVMKILQTIRPDRQAIMFSATLPKNMAALARKALKDPAEVTIGGRSVVAPEVSQEVEIVQSSSDKMTNLMRHLGLLFNDNEDAQVLIFVERQETAEDLLSKLFKAKYQLINSIHGAKDQEDRDEAITDFKQGKLPILIATSVAARGLDVPGLAMVINFDCPTHLEDYVHRCGRTGRAGNKGRAITFLEHPGQERFAPFIVKALKQSGSEVPDRIQKIADDFNKDGNEKWFSGFGGKGLEKLAAVRTIEKRREKRSLQIEGDDVSEDEAELPGFKKPEVTANGAPSDKATADLPSYMQILTNKIVVSKSERAVDAGPSKPLTPLEKAKLAASKVDGRLSRKGTIHFGQPVDNKGPDAGAFHSTIEINDFPQKARWAVTNRTNVVKILDDTGVSITTKGNFYAAGEEPGKNGRSDEPKLYILVEGDTENVVTEAMGQITRLLKDATLNAGDVAAGPARATGRYSVL